MSHFDNETLQRFADGAITAGESSRCEEHLAECAPCRRAVIDRRFWADDSTREAPPRLVAAARQLGTGRRPRRSSRAWFAAAAAIFLLVIGLAALRSPKGDSVQQDVLRAGSSDNPSLDLISPVDDAVVAAAGFELTWTPVPEARRYTVRLLNDRGDIVFEQASDESRLQVQGLAPESHGSVYWYVSATTKSGEVIESPIRPLAIVAGTSEAGSPAPR